MFGSPQPPPSCVVTNQPPPPPPVAAACTAQPPFVQGGTYTTHSTASGTTATLACTQGYQLSTPFGVSAITCTNNQWSQQTVSCVPTQAAPPPPAGCTAPLPTAAGGTYTHSTATSATLTCRQGYTLSPFGSATITCTNNQWSAGGKTCTITSTGPPPPPPGSNPFNPPPPPAGGGCALSAYPQTGGTYTQTVAGQQATLSCTFPAQPTNANVQIECVGSQWMPCLPTCGQQALAGQVPAMCGAAAPPPPPPPPPSGQCAAPLPFVQGGAYNWASATTATLTCSQGYTASSPFGSTITCTNNQWSQQTVVCNAGVGRRLQEGSEPDTAAELKLLVEPPLAE